jgi:hypothetical protein
LPKYTISKFKLLLMGSKNDLVSRHSLQINTCNSFSTINILNIYFCSSAKVHEGSHQAIRTSSSSTLQQSILRINLCLENKKRNRFINMKKTNRRERLYVFKLSGWNHEGKIQNRARMLIMGIQVATVHANYWM